MTEFKIVIHDQTERMNVFALRKHAQEQHERILELTQKLNSFVRVGTALFVKRGFDTGEAEILWIKRAGSHAAGRWCIPGGWMDHGEEPADAVIREAHEECGPDLVFAPPYYLGATNDVFPEGVHSFCLFYSAVLLEGEPRIMEPMKATAMEWRPYDDWPTPLMAGLESWQKGQVIR